MKIIFITKITDTFPNKWVGSKTLYKKISKFYKYNNKT